MGHFLYAVPAEKADQVDGIGLGKIIKRPLSKRGVSKGPAETCAILTSGDGSTCSYDPEKQVWTKSVVGDWWIGYWSDDRPTEKDLRRAERLEGHKVRLADGADWLIPVVRLLDGGCGLPAAVSFGENGQAVTKPLAKYSQLSAAAERLWTDLMIACKKVEGTESMTETERIDLAIDALGWNYHIDRDEIGALEILTTQNLKDIYSAIMDIPTLLKAAKKKLSDDSNSKDGPPA